MEPTTSVVFLHIPKTAGQSVHSVLEKLFGADKVLPARVNEQLRFLSIQDIRRYRVASGHLDWSLIDCVPEPRFVFTVLRDPVDRILSFYFFLRKDAARLTPEALALPQNTGKKAALTLSCDEYFLGGERSLRTFLDNHYDNFYAYYFAGRTFDARQRLLAAMRDDPSFTPARVVDMALANLATLSGVYTVGSLDRLGTDLCEALGRSELPVRLSEVAVNRGDGASREARFEQLKALGATQRTFDRIIAMTVLDEQIWSHYSGLEPRAGQV